jgi:hypothetical protein
MRNQGPLRRRGGSRAEPVLLHDKRALDYIHSLVPSRRRGRSDCKVSAEMTTVMEGSLLTVHSTLAAHQREDAGLRPPSQPTNDYRGYRNGANCARWQM